MNKTHKSKATKTIRNAKDYYITVDGEVFSRKSFKEISQTNGSVRLMVDGSRKTFKVKKLMETYFPKADYKAKSENHSVEDVSNNADKPKKPKKAASKSKDKAKPKKGKKGDKAEPKTNSKSNLSNGKKIEEKDRKAIRKLYDKDPKKFSIAKTAKKYDISYGRVWGMIKTHTKKSKK